MRILSLSLALLLAPFAVACGVTSPHGGAGEKTGKVSAAVQGGSLDTSDAHNYAVGIANRYGGVCSGTLIAPNLVLTARHCVVPPDGNEGVTCSDTFGKNVAPSALGITTSTNLYRTRDYYQAKEIITPADTGFCGNDIALIILEETIPASEATPATPVVQFSMTDRSRIGSKVVAFGYGISSPTANDSGQRRMREDIGILCIPGDKSRECSGSMKNMVDSDKEFVTEGWVCSGDSGGGAFEQGSYDVGAPYVLGALSRGPQTDEECLAAIYTRTDAHAEMIIAAGVKAASEGGYDEPGWLKPASAEADPTGVECDGETCTDIAATDPTDEPTTIKKTTTGCSTTGAPADSSNMAAVAAISLGAILIGRRRRQA
jgi:MYXO-CTERM domain-containing protein